MTKNTMIFIFLNMIYLLIWHATNKIRSTKAGKELDNGFEFYNSLNTSDKENEEMRSEYSFLNFIRASKSFLALEVLSFIE